MNALARMIVNAFAPHVDGDMIKRIEQSELAADVADDRLTATLCRFEDTLSRSTGPLCHHIDEDEIVEECD